MRTLFGSLAAGTVLLLTLACTGGGSASTPSTISVEPVVTGASPPLGLQSGPITFATIGTDGAAVSTYSELGYTVTATSGGWQAGTSYGNPSPYVRFVAQMGTTVTAELQVTGAGLPFTFSSVDLYSSTTPIPYTIVGSRSGSPVFTVTGTVPNTYGKFRTVPNPNASSVIDTLSITLVNPAAKCCTNPMGIDNIVVVKQ